MAENTVRVAANPLKAFAQDVFVRVGMTQEDADKVADVLIWANLRGVDSHGVLRISSYLGWIETGQINARPEMRVTRETPASMVIDADRALGLISMPDAMNRAIAKAREVGIGWVLVGHTGHAGPVGYYTLMAARENMAGLVTLGSMPLMTYPGARTAGVATSPLAIAVPGAAHAPLMLDMATSIASVGKLLQARNTETALPEGWAIDKEGNPTTDPNKATVPTPLGGHKGAGLALMFECLTSLMVGNPILEVELLGLEGAGRHQQNGLAVAIDIAAFTDPGAFKTHVDTLAEVIKGLPRAEGAGEILVPGEHGDAIAVERGRDGIPLPPGTLRGLTEIAERLEIKLPPTL